MSDAPSLTTTDIQRLDDLTMRIAAAAEQFGISFRSAAHRAIGLGLMTMDDQRGIEALAAVESEWRKEGREIYGR